MTRYILLIITLSLFSCKKDSVSRESKDYELTVECDDCEIGFASYREGVSNKVKGVLVIPYASVPSSITFTIWSHVADDKAKVSFKGPDYPNTVLFDKILKYQNNQYDLVTKTLK